MVTHKKYLRFKKLALAAAMGWVIYLIAGNVLLQTPWLQTQLSRKKALNITWQTGSTFFPGHVRLNHFAIKGNHRLVGWDLQSAHVSGWINLLALPLKGFHAYAIHGSELETRIQPRSNPPPRQSRKPGWTVRLNGLDIHGMRQVIFGDLKLNGRGQLGGQVHFQVRGKVDLSRADLTFHSAELKQENQVIAKAMTFTIEGGIQPFQPGSQRPRTLLDLVTGRFNIEADVTSLGFLDIFLERAPWLKLSGGGHLKGQWQIERGLMVPESFLNISKADLQAQYLETVVIGEAEIKIHVADQQPAAQLRLNATITPFQVVSSAGEAYINGHGFQLLATSQNLRLSQPFDDLIADVRLPESEIPDLTVYNAYLPAKTSVAITSGHGRLAANFHFEASSHKGHGDMDLWGDAVQASVDQLPMAGTFHLKAKMHSTDLLARVFELQGSQLSLVDIYTGDEKASAQPWKGLIAIEEGQVIWRQPMALDAQLHMDLQDSAPLVALMAQRQKIIAWSQDLLTVKHLVGKGYLRMEEEAVILSPFRIDGDQLEILGQLKFNQNVTNGKMYIGFHRFKLGIALKDSKRNFKLIRPLKWYKSQADLP